ncbi:MAG: YeeE/YedE family protein [Alphaproteobacteria bacterium]|nr:YeeE/YedE family protein [Alphaproteobacteria bacterium]
MDLLLSFSETLGEDGLLALGGLLIGMLFGSAAQRSRFCLRSAAVEFSRGTFGPKLAVWLLAFSTGVILTQMLFGMEVLDTSEIRQLTLQGSLSGAIIGGAMFGTGMILARGCSSRMLVLAGQGNLRALLNGLVFAVAAQASLRGILHPVRDYMAGLWTVSGAQLDVLGYIGQGWVGGLLIGLVWLAAAIYFAIRSKVGVAGWLGGIGAGGAIGLAWAWTGSLNGELFVPVKLESLTFTGPSANTLMWFLSPQPEHWRFDVALVPGVFIGSFFAAAWARELKLEGFQGATGMPRYLFGAALMGFGGMLAGGCAVGSLTNASVFAATGWTALLSIWAAAAIADYVLDRGQEPQSAASAREAGSPLVAGQ